MVQVAGEAPKSHGLALYGRGAVKVVNVQPKVSVAQVIFSCDYMQRGDILVDLS